MFFLPPRHASRMTSVLVAIAMRARPRSWAIVAAEVGGVDLILLDPRLDGGIILWEEALVSLGEKALVCL